MLATLNNNLGTLSTVGTVRLNGAILDFDEFAGFDIFTTPGGMNTAYALLTVGNNAGLYTLDLASGNATSLGAARAPGRSTAWPSSPPPPCPSRPPWRFWGSASGRWRYWPIAVGSGIRRGSRPGPGYERLGARAGGG